MFYIAEKLELIKAKLGIVTTVVVFLLVSFGSFQRACELESEKMVLSKKWKKYSILNFVIAALIATGYVIFHSI